MATDRTSQLSASPPLFKNKIFDFFSRVHPIVPLVFFGPIVVGGLWLAVDHGLSGWGTVGMFAAGVAIWTLSEYWLHRLLFHWQPKIPGGDRIHFIMHGVHHDHPNDPMRLVMPPAVSIPLSSVFAVAFYLIFGDPLAFPVFSGFIAGYLVYDYTHYHVHHHRPKTNFGRRLREHHMRHHFQDHRFGYGVSSPLWDAIFRTMPRNRKAEQSKTEPGSAANKG